MQDRAGLLSKAQQARVAAYHEGLREDHGVDYRVLTASGVADIDEYANRSFREMRVGDASAQGRGLLLVVDPAYDRVRLEVGGRLEPVLTDAFVAYVEREQMVPFFRSGRVADGILATTELLVERLRDGALDTNRADSFAAGAGASSRAFIDAGPEPGPARAVAPPMTISATADPTEVVAAYLEAMARHDARSDLPVYSRASRTFLAQWTVTRAQMDNVVRTAATCRWNAPVVDASGRRAVIVADPEARACAPWLLVREEGAWRLDLASMNELTRFGRDNAWRFARVPPGAYGFAFNDWDFDGNGYPRARR